MQGIKQSSYLPFLRVVQHFAASYFSVQFEMRRFIATICLMTGIYFDDAPERAAHPYTHLAPFPPHPAPFIHVESVAKGFLSRLMAWLVGAF